MLASPAQAAPWQVVSPLLSYVLVRCDAVTASKIANATSAAAAVTAWTVSEVGLEDLVLAYMKQAAGPAPRNNHRHLEIQK